MGRSIWEDLLQISRLNIGDHPAVCDRVIVVAYYEFVRKEDRWVAAYKLSSMAKEAASRNWLESMAGKLRGNRRKT